MNKGETDTWATRHFQTSAEIWRRRGQERCAAAFAEATSTADRLALLREWARLNDGYLDLGVLGLDVKDISTNAANFGLEISDSILRIVDEQFSTLPAEVGSVFQLDSSNRRVYHRATPDGALLRWSAHTSYQSETQKAAVRALLTMPPRATLMVSMPTGTGKSLLFQMAPRAWARDDAKACVVVITPTVSLAHDHERTLSGIEGLEGSRALTGQLSPSERVDVLNEFRRGEIPILLLSPEHAFGAAREAIFEAALPPSEKSTALTARLVGFFIDEAHIVESWGRSFRPDFQRLPGLVQELKTRNPDLRTVLLSATLTRAARTVLKQAYADGEYLDIHAGVPRYEFDVVALSYIDRQARDRDLRIVVDHAPRPAIIYTSLVKHAEELFGELRDRGYERIALFTGDISDPERHRIVREWAQNKLDLVVATSAFGMGIDKADVRTVIHACLPESPARYYQEIGRAGRDGFQAICICLWTRGDWTEDNDESLANRLAGNSWLKRTTAVQRWTDIRLRAEKKGAIKWIGAVRRAEIDLDTGWENHGPRPTDYHRRWNMSLLNLLQRASVIRVSSVNDPKDGLLTWEVDVCDDALFQPGAEHEELWDRVEVLRNQEQQVSFEELRAFRSILRQQYADCLVKQIYELIDADADSAPACGHCANCRRRHVRAPAIIHSGGLERRWNSLCSTIVGAIPPGITIVVPDDPHFEDGSAELSTTLAMLGIEQFVVPDGAGPSYAAALAKSVARFGFVLEASEWTSGDGWKTADLPTAAIFDRHYNGLETLWRRVNNASRELPHQIFVIVAPNDVRVGGRPLQQVASRQAPYTENILKELASSWSKSGRH